MSSVLTTRNPRRNRGPRPSLTESVTRLSTTKQRNGRNRSNRSAQSSAYSTVPKFRSSLKGDNRWIERGIPGFAMPRYRASLNYFDYFSLQTGVIAAGTYVYSANGCYDPDITSTGHQPMGFDQIMLSFEHYCVIGAKMVANFRSTSGTNSLSVAVSLNAGSTPTSNFVTLMENGLLTHGRLGLQNSTQDFQTLTMPIAISQFCSVPDLLGNPDFKGTIAANPVEQAYFHISTWNPSDSSQHSVQVEVFIEYDVVFFEPRKNSQSLNKQFKRLIMAESKQN